MSSALPILSNNSLAQATRNCPLLEGREEAWIACCSKRFTPLAKRIAGDDGLALDVLQESWIRVLTSVHAYRSGSPACAWVRKIVANCATDSQRRKHGEVPLLEALDNQPSMAPSAEHRAMQAEMLILVEAIVAELPKAYRQVIELRYRQECSTAEAAELLHISRSNAATRLNRAVAMIRKQVHKHLQAVPTP